MEAPNLEPYRKIDGRQIVAGAIATLERYRLSDAARQDYLSSFEGERFAESMRYVRTYPEQLPVLSDLLPTIETPVQIIAGARNPVVPPLNAEYLHERLPRSKLDLIDAVHFVWEDVGAFAPGLTPRSVLEKFSAVQMIDVHIPTTNGREIQLPFRSRACPMRACRKAIQRFPSASDRPSGDLKGAWSHALQDASRTL